MNLIDRRRFERFSVAPMYTAVAVRRLPDGEEIAHGHAYDIGEGGVKFELDEPLDRGTPLLMQIDLPGPCAAGGGGRSVFAFARVVRGEADPDEPGPARMAAEFTAFGSAGDRERLLERLGSGELARAA